MLALTHAIMRARLVPVVLVVSVSAWLAPVARAVDPVTAFVLAYLGDKVVDAAFDTVTGKPDLKLLDQRLRELEASSALRADVQLEIGRLRARLDEHVTKQQFQSMVEGLGAQLRDINARLDSLEKRSEILEVELEDTRNATNNVRLATHFLDRAGRMFGAQDYRRTITNCTIAIELDPNLAQAYFRRGQAYWNLNAPPQLTMVDYDRTISLEPDHADAHGSRAAQWQRLGNHERAIEDYTLALELDPSAYFRYADRAYNAMQLGEYEQAIEDYTAALAAEQSSAWYALRGWAYASSELFTHALEDCKRAASLDPQNAVIYLTRCQVYTKRQDHDLGAIVHQANRAIELAPTEFLGFYFRGKARLQMAERSTSSADHIRDLLATAEADLLEGIRLASDDRASRVALQRVRALLRPQPQGNELPIDGTWTLRAFRRNVEIPRLSGRTVTIRDRTLTIEGDKSRWENIQRLSNGRYAATRVDPALWEMRYDVKLYVDGQGVLRQDDSHLGVLHRSLNALEFHPSALAFENAFEAAHPKH